MKKFALILILMIPTIAYSQIRIWAIGSMDKTNTNTPKGTMIQSDGEGTFEFVNLDSIVGVDTFYVSDDTMTLITAIDTFKFRITVDTTQVNNLLEFVQNNSVNNLDTLNIQYLAINDTSLINYIIAHEVDGDPGNELDSFYSSNNSRWIENGDTLSIQADTTSTDIVKPNWEAWFEEIYTSLVTAKVEGIYNERPAGSINGENLKFVLLNEPVVGTVRLYRNGVRQSLEDDFTVLADEITFVTAPEAGDKLIADYVLLELKSGEIPVDTTPAQQSLLASSLVAVWPLNETTGTTVVDHGAYGANGTSVLLDSLAKTAPANLGYSYDFNTNSYLEWEDNNIFSFPDNSPFSISLWVKPTDMSNIRMFLTKSPGTTGEFLVHTTSTKNVNFALFQNNTTTRIDYSTDSDKLVLNQWNHILVTYDGLGLTTSANIYVNGVNEALTTTGVEIPLGLDNTSNVLRFGKESDGQFSFIGYATQIALFDEKLTSYEDSLLYGNGNGLNHEDWGVIDTITPPVDTVPEGESESYAFSFPGTGYYISSSTGSDATGNGTIGNPYASIDKVNTLTLSAGDAVLFKRGDEFSGTIIANYSGTSGNKIGYAAYGTGVKPKIYNSQEITGWTNHAGNIYKATVSETIYQLFIDGQRQMMARTPNTGYHITSSVSGSTQLTSTTLNGSINYAGATWVGKTTAFTIFNVQVASSSSQTLTLATAPLYGIGVGRGFFLANKLEFLDSAGEWYYDDNTNTLYVWTPGGDSPANYTVRGSTTPYGIIVDNKDYITIDGLEILHSSNTGIYLNNADYALVNNTRVISTDLYGIYMPSNSPSPVITNNYIYETGTGIRCMGSPATISGNTIDRIGLLEDINRTTFTHDNFGTAIYSRNNTPTIENNVITNTGYCGINWKGTNGEINYNYVNGICQTLGDGAGIYTYNRNVPNASVGSDVEYNIVLNVHGNRLGYTDTYDVGYGIYLDEETTGVLVQNNTIGNSSCGYFIHDAGNNTFQYNTVFDVLLGIRASGEYSNCYHYNNLFYATSRIGDFTWWSDRHEMFQVRDASTPIYNNNRYIHPYATDAFRSGSNMNFAAWKSATGQDAASTFESPALATGAIPELFYNNSMTSKTYSVTGTNVKDIDGATVTGFTLAAFTSKILTGQNIVVTEVP